MRGSVHAGSGHLVHAAGFLTFLGEYVPTLAVTEQLATKYAAEEHPETRPAPPANPRWRRAAPATGGGKRPSKTRSALPGSCAEIEAMREVGPGSKTKNGEYTVMSALGRMLPTSDPPERTSAHAFCWSSQTMTPLALS